MSDETTVEPTAETTPETPETPAPTPAPKAKGAVAKATELSDEMMRAVVLKFVRGTGKVLSNIPARDLTGADLSRRVFIETRLKRDAADFGRVYDALVERLVSTGLYEQEK